MRSYRSTNQTLNNVSRKNSLRPNSAAKRHFNFYKINSSSQTPPPIIFTMPNNPKKLSGMGNKIEREQLYENNMQLKDIINKLKKELAETRNQVVKKDIEIRKKERIIKECSKENDLESVHELNLEKARESTLVSLCKDKYNQLKNLYTKKCEENEILKANIKITKLKEYKIQIDVLKNEMEKISALYINTSEENAKFKKEIDEYQKLKNKYIEQHNIINNFIKKCNQYNDDINNLKEENDFLKNKLEENIKQQKELKRANIKLKISNNKYLNHKKTKENYDINIDDNKKLISYLRKELNEYKRLYGLRNIEFNKLLENSTKLEKDKKYEKEDIKPFNFNQVKVIENKKDDKDTNKLNLYKSLLDESRHKIEIYELYLKKMGVDKDKLIKAFGYDGVLTSNTKIIENDIENNNTENNNIEINNIENEINNDKENNLTENNNNENEINNEKENNTLNQKEKINNNIDNRIEKNSNENNNNENNIENNININENNNLESIELNVNNNNINNNNLVSTEGNEEINKEETIQNINNLNSISDANSINSNNLNTNANTVSDNMKKLSSIEEEKQEEAYYLDENQFYSLLHVFIKNLESQGITKEKINQKIEDITQLFENKEEATKEEFIEPFLKMLVETMKVTQEKDIEIINNFLSDFVDSSKGDTVLFFNILIKIFDNIKDFTGINKDLELLFELNQYKDQLLNMLNQYDREKTHLITFDIFRKIVQNLNLELDDESMEYLIYKMKKNVPENNSIFDLNYEIIEKLFEKKNEIGEIFTNIKNTLNNNKTNIDSECEEFLNSFEYKDLKFLIIKRDDFFSVIDKLNISINDEIKNSIYQIFKIDIEIDKKRQQYWMEYDRLRSELE